MPGDGLLAEDPRLINPSGDDFRLASTSPCIKAGTPAGTDMGAIEYIEGISLMPNADFQFAIALPRTPQTGGHIMDLPQGYEGDIRLFSLDGQEAKGLVRTGNSLSLERGTFHTGWHLLGFDGQDTYWPLLLLH